MIPEEAIRQRSYLIWQREGQPGGKALDHWFRAKTELEAEYRASLAKSWKWRERETVMPRLPISLPPQTTIAEHVPADERHARVTAPNDGNARHRQN